MEDEHKRNIKISTMVTKIEADWLEEMAGNLGIKRGPLLHKFITDQVGKDERHFPGYKKSDRPDRSVYFKLTQSELDVLMAYLDKRKMSKNEFFRQLVHKKLGIVV